MTGSLPRARAVAFHLPQFHPTPENDEWWGAGFTEWTNVTRSRPRFPGHKQPVLPSDLGFYDLRLPEARAAQAALAHDAGIEAFCYWHYWFDGRRVLQRPVEEIRTSGEPDFSYCLAWANESWSRRWLGEERDVLLSQNYSAEDDRAHALYLVSIFADRRYLRVDGRPVFLVYRPLDHPDISSFISELRSACRPVGQEPPFLIAINAHGRGADYRALGFEETLDFQPQLGVLKGAFQDGRSLARIGRNLRLGAASSSIRMYDEQESRSLFRRTRPSNSKVPCVFVGWDNSPRRGHNATIIKSLSVDPYESALDEAVADVATRDPAQRLVFINAWNEWAEGNHLEPDHRQGDAYLAATRRVLLGRG